MAKIQKFRSPSLKDYYFDSEAGAVFSTKRPGDPYKLKWMKKYHRDQRRVNLYTDSGEKICMTYAQVQSALQPAQVATDSVATTDLSKIRPEGEYVLFSTKNRCSQYFYDGTSLSDALRIFAKRDIVIDPEDIRVLMVNTNQIMRLGAKTVYTLT